MLRASGAARAHSEVPGSPFPDAFPRGGLGRGDFSVKVNQGKAAGRAGGGTLLLHGREVKEARWPGVRGRGSGAGVRARVARAEGR